MEHEEASTQAADAECAEAKRSEGSASSTFSTGLSLEDIRETQEQFVNERDWKKYHTPRNVMLALVGEVGELAEIFQWKGEVDVGLPGWNAKERKHLGQELSDVLIYLVRLADICKVDLPVAVMEKFEINRHKYPANLVRGEWRKYNTYAVNDADTSGNTTNHE